MGITEVPAASTNHIVAVKHSPQSAVSSNTVQKTPVTIINKHPKNKKEVPQTVDGQLNIVFHNAIYEMEFIPKWLYMFGVDKIKKELTEMINSKKFRAEMKTLFEQARIKHDSPNKDVIELLKKRDVFDDVYACMNSNTRDKSLLKKIMSFEFVKEKYYKMVSKGSPDCLLYGDYPQ